MNRDAQDAAAAVVDEIIESLTAEVAAVEAKKLETFARHFVRRLSLAQLQVRSAWSWATLLRGRFKFMERRIRSRTRIKIYNPSLEKDGWESPHTLIDVLSPDRPFLVDSASMAVADSNCTIHLLIHPVYQVTRDAGGYLMDLSSGQDEVPGASGESLMHFQIDRHTDPRRLAGIKERVEANLADVALAVRDWAPMRDKLADIVEELKSAKTPYPPEAVAETLEFLTWLGDDHFTFLGYRRYRIERRGKKHLLEAEPDSGLGILSDHRDGEGEDSATVMRTLEPQAISESGPMVLTKTNSRATVHRAGYMDYIGVMSFDSKGALAGEQRILGLFTSSAYNRRPWNIPFVRHKVDAVMQRSGFSAASHGGKTLLHIMETLPRDELFQATTDELSDLVMGVYDLQERQKTSLFIRADRFGRYYSCLVYIPRDRFNTETREAVQAILKRALNGLSVDFTVQVAESMLARLHVIVRVDPGKRLEHDQAKIEEQLIDAVRSWHDKLKEVLIDKHGEEVGADWAARIGSSFPAAYIEDVSPWVAAFDVANTANLRDENDLRMSLYRPRKRHVGLFRFKIFRRTKTIPLSDVLPMLENMGLRIVSERPYRLQMVDGSVNWIQDFDMQLAAGGDLDLPRVRGNFQAAFDRIARGEVESDGFNRLILGANLDWRQVTMLRAYCKYLLQTGVPFSQTYMEQALTAHPAIARLIIELFATRLDPARDDTKRAAASARAAALKTELGELIAPQADKALDELIGELLDAQGRPREAQAAACLKVLRHLVDSVRSLDEDRILRGFVRVVRATLRTNYFQTGDHGKPKPYLSFKLDSERVPDLPKPRPWREIFVYSPRVEGIHLRGGPVARGGLRWSDRREDFRTEVLGLMKAQMVKNTLIVPVGAKGGFVPKRLPEDGDRDVLMAEVVTCYRWFISGLLDLTDNLKDEKLVVPENLVRHDPDDSYLVVAADKGTATFSDIANSVSEAYGFWMGDAFASGGSAGYDHKKMGITAKGAWESVKRHFRERGLDCQKQDFTVVGIGDMSGDVFGNGMLLSRHIKLMAAFNHQHIFLDPDPDPKASFRERKRLFDLPRSAWTDYRANLISEGGGVYSRKEKTIEITPQVQAWLGIKAKALSPNELIRELLKAPVDLLWNGGIGTYVKASVETNATVGDRANDALRVDAKDLRCAVVGEGGNLGLTHRGRIEFALKGGHVNTDFIDNSGGVDCSDHEVNIKILLNQQVRKGELSLEERNRLLAEMTDEVAALVLRNNYLQSQALSVLVSLSVSRLGSKAHFIAVLEGQGVLDRELENLPTSEELNERRTRGVGLTRPEVATLLSYGKITLYQQLLASDAPEDPYLSRELVRYFPKPLQERYRDAMEGHRLRREIIATVVTNSMVNRMGATFALRMHEETGASPAQIAKAYSAAREIFQARKWWDAIEGCDNKGDSAHQTEAHIAVWSLLRHTTRWLLNHHHHGKLDIARLVERYAGGTRELIRLLPKVVSPGVRKRIAANEKRYRQVRFPATLKRELAAIPALTAALDVVDVALDTGREVADVATAYYRLDQIMKLSWLIGEVQSLAVEGQWHARARGELRDELYRQHRKLTARVIGKVGGAKVTSLVEDWSKAHKEQLAHYEHMLSDMKSAGEMDYATLTVAVRGLEQMVLASARGA